MLERLKTMLSVLDSSGTLTKSDKAFVKKSYLSVIGSELVTSSGCKNCWKDGLIILIRHLSGSKLKLKFGAVITYQGKHYGHKTITEEITNIVLAEKPELKHLFYGL